MWEYIVQPEMPQMTVQRMRISCRVPKATDTQSEYVISIFFFHNKNGCTKAPHCYITCTLPVLLVLVTGTAFQEGKRSPVQRVIWYEAKIFSREIGFILTVSI